MLLLLIGMPLAGIIGILLAKDTKFKIVALNFSLLTLIYSIYIWIIFDNSATFQMIENLSDSWKFSAGEILSTSTSTTATLNWILGIDGISLFLVLLTTFLIPITILASWNSIQENEDGKSYLILFLLLEALLIAVFLVVDLIVFYILFESILLPMFIIIGKWGSKKSYLASFYFFLYTLIGSLLMLIGILYIERVTGSTNLIYLMENFSPSFGVEKWLWISFFLSFAVKIPLIPFHIWLPMAHVEAPAAASALLAGILLKIGSYGFLRFLIPLFPAGSEYFTPLVMLLGIIGIIYGSLTAIRQTDIKRIIAYSSIAHVGLSVIGIFTFNLQGLYSSILYQVSHGLTSAALFLLVGFLYDRYHTRVLKYYRGLTLTMPIFSVIFLFFTFASIGTPPTLPFLSEILVLISAWIANPILAIFSCLGLVLSTAYSLWLYTRLFYGSYSNHLAPYISEAHTKHDIKEEGHNLPRDLNRREVYALLPIIILELLFGIKPNILLDSVYSSCSTLI